MLKEILNYPNYLISDEGLVYSKHKKGYLAIDYNKQVDYPQVSLWKNNKSTTFYIHRLVAIAFIPNPNNLPEVNHIDGNRRNNHVSNLEWVDSSGNKLHAIRTGLRKYTNKMSSRQIEDCLNEVLSGKSITEVSKKDENYNLSELSIRLKEKAKQLGIYEKYMAELRRQKVIRNRKALKSIQVKKAQRLS